MALHHREHDREDEERARGILGDLGQDIARPRAEQGVRRCPPKREAGPGLLLRKLDQHQQNQRH